MALVKRPRWGPRALLARRKARGPWDRSCGGPRKPAESARTERRLRPAEHCPGRTRRPLVARHADSLAALRRHPRLDGRRCLDEPWVGICSQLGSRRYFVWIS